MTHHIQHLVDQLLLEQGEYRPLEFLLQEGRLSYADYEAWRTGELDFLDEALFGDPDHIQQDLLQAEEYLQRRGWQAETLSYEAWRRHGHAGSRPLRFSANTNHDARFHRRYRKPEDQPQLDLFSDAPATTLFNGITRALIDRNPPEARRQLERLYETAPDHIRLGELERLVEAAEGLNSLVSDAAAELHALQQTLTPLAEDLLGKDSRNLLIPLWRRLSCALRDQPYRSTEPELHLSYTAGRALDWEAVRRAVEQEPRWHTDAVLLLRHAQACDQLHQQAAALASWFELCWRFPAQGDVLASSGNHELRRQWTAYLDLDPELPVQSFPAWLLLSKPGLTNILPDPDNHSRVARGTGDGVTVCPASYRTLYRLQHDRVQAHAERGTNDTMALRARLKQQDPVLFQHFLQFTTHRLRFDVLRDA
jgi:hypothetical protein